MNQDPPRRVRVTNPHVGPSRYRARSAAEEIDEASKVGEVYVRSLMRYQLGLALAIVAVIIVTVGSLPLLFVLNPDLAAARLFGVPVAWIVLGFVMYPVLLFCGWIYVRRVERAEADFVELVDRP